jgi:hypothetical protein
MIKQSSIDDVVHCLEPCLCSSRSVADNRAKKITIHAAYTATAYLPIQKVQMPETARLSSD